jgi:hypothetical protein
VAEDAAIQIAYNRRMLGQLVVFYRVFCILLLPMIVFLGGGAIHLTLIKSWPNRLLGLLGLLEVGVLVIGVPYFFGYVSSLRRAFQRNEPAMIINRTGIVDHVSTYMVGQIAWDEIQRIGPWTRERRLIPNPFLKTPLISKYRFVAIVMKDKAYLERLPRLKSLQLRIDANACYGRQLLVPENFLEINADELLTRLNDFYMKEVRGPG